MTHPVQTVRVTEWHVGQERRISDDIVSEEPLEIRVNGAAVSVTMRTPGDDLDLALGFLFTEGIIDEAQDVARIDHAQNGEGHRQCNVVEVDLAGRTFDRERLQRHFFASSSCGICGKATIDAIRARALPLMNDEARIDAGWLTGLPDALKASQPVFDRTGGLHAAALFNVEDGSLVDVKEDIGRHNAVDKIIGGALARRALPLSQHVLLVSGRSGFEIVQKAVAAGLPILASISAPSSLAVQLAADHGVTLIGFLRGGRFVAYSGHQRIASSDPAATSTGQASQ